MKNVHGALAGDTLDLSPPVAALGVVGHGQPLKGVRLEAAGKGAQVLHDGELPAGGHVGGAAGGDTGEDGRHF